MIVTAFKNKDPEKYGKKREMGGKHSEFIEGLLTSEMINNMYIL